MKKYISKTKKDVVNLPSNEKEDSNKKNLSDVIESLPESMKSVLNLLDEPEEKKMGLFGITAVVGALMPDVWFNYDGKVNYPGLMVNICYPPGSGKGKLALIPKLLNKITIEQIQKNQELMKEYEKKIKEYEKRFKDGKNITRPNKPKCPLLLVPGNITSAKLMEQISENDENSMTLIFETEADALTSMMNGKFGRETSMILRKGFHHESISYMRKTNNEHLVVNTPKTSVVLCGTFSQTKKLFSNVEDGFFSRFINVNGHIQNQWHDVQPKDGSIPLDKQFEELGNIYYKLYKFFQNQSVEFRLSDEQWQSINAFGKMKLPHSLELAGENATSIAKRHALIIARIACILSMFRYFETNCTDKISLCQDEDFDSAMLMGEESYQNSIELFQTLQNETSEIDNEILEKILQQLPLEFKRNQINHLKGEYQISDRSLSRYLKELVDKRLLESIRKGFYRKNVVTDIGIKPSE